MRRMSFGLAEWLYEKAWLAAPAMLAIAVVAAPGMASAQPAPVPTACDGRDANGGGCPPTVENGTDYFQTEPGAFFQLGGQTVNLVGVPIGPGNTDTIVQRTRDIVINSAQSAPNLQITALSMEGTGAFTNVFVTLDPLQLANDTGTMTINGTLAGGTFNSNLNVFFDVCLGGEGANGVGCGAGSLLQAGSIALSQAGAGWSPDAPLGAQIVFGDDCLNDTSCTPDQLLSEQLANEHTTLDTGEVDFWPIAGTTDECQQPDGCHPVDPALPEPASLALFGTALLGLAGVRRRRR